MMFHLLLGDHLHLVDVVPYQPDEVAEARLLVQALEHHPRARFRAGGPSPGDAPSRDTPRRRPSRGRSRTPGCGSVGRGLEQAVRRV